MKGCIRNIRKGRVNSFYNYTVNCTTYLLKFPSRDEQKLNKHGVKVND